jgi:ribulose-5-phosphate 4-epimerase/fuculose-1-phosphate aldolase
MSIKFSNLSGLDFPTPPTFEHVEDERIYRQQRLVAAFRLFARYGFDEGVAGHITIRDPELLDCFWVNPFGMHFGHIRVSDLLLVNHQGEVVKLTVRSFLGRVMRWG